MATGTAVQPCRALPTAANTLLPAFPASLECCFALTPSKPLPCRAYVMLLHQTFADAPHAASGPIPRDVAPFFSPPHYEWFTVESVVGVQGMHSNHLRYPVVCRFQCARVSLVLVSDPACFRPHHTTSGSLSSPWQGTGTSGGWPCTSVESGHVHRCICTRRCLGNRITPRSSVWGVVVNAMREWDM